MKSSGRLLSLVSQLSRQVQAQAQEVSTATSSQQPTAKCPAAAGGAGEEQVVVPACDPGGSSQERVPALMLLETWRWAWSLPTRRGPHPTPGKKMCWDFTP